MLYDFIDVVAEICGLFIVKVRIQLLAESHAVLGVFGCPIHDRDPICFSNKPNHSDGFLSIRRKVITNQLRGKHLQAPHVDSCLFLLQVVSRLFKHHVRFLRWLQVWAHVLLLRRFNVLRVLLLAQLCGGRWGGGGGGGGGRGRRRRMR